MGDLGGGLIGMNKEAIYLHTVSPSSHQGLLSGMVALLSEAHEQIDRFAVGAFVRPSSSGGLFEDVEFVVFKEGKGNF